MEQAGKSSIEKKNKYLKKYHRKISATMRALIELSKVYVKILSKVSCNGLAKFQFF